MKLRILDNTLRFRLSQSEVNELIAGTSVSASVGFSGDTVFEYAITPDAKCREWDATFANNRITVALPSTVAEQLTDPDTITLEARVTHPDKSSLSIKIEKDFRCLQPRPDENEADLFEHPASDSTDNVC